MTTDDAPRPALDAAGLARLREEYAPEPEPRDCLRIPCGYRGPLRLVRTDDAGWRGWCCPKCGESLRYTAPGDPDVLALLAALEAAAARADAHRAKGRAEMLAEAVAYLRQCGRDEWAVGLEAALAAKEGD